MNEARARLLGLVRIGCDRKDGCACVDRQCGIAVDARRETGSEPDRQMREIFEMGLLPPLLQSGVDDEIEIAKHQQIEEPERRHRHGIDAPQRAEHLEAGVGALAGDFVDGGAVSEQGVVERPSASENGRTGIVREHHAPAIADEKNGDGRGDLVRAQNDGESFLRQTAGMQLQIVAHG